MEPILSIVIDRKSINAALAPILKDTEAEGAKLLQRVGAAAVRLLSGMDRGAGHPFLASQWAASPVKHDDDGYQVDVFSQVESQTLYNRSGNPGSKFASGGKTPWKVKGEQLIALLEYGVEPHRIEPRASTWRNGRPARLIFSGLGDENDDPVPVSDFLGTVRIRKGVAIAGLDNREDFDPRLVVTSHVDHPGHPGFHFLEATKQEIERGLQAEVDLMERGLAVRLA